MRKQCGYEARLRYTSPLVLNTQVLVVTSKLMFTLLQYTLTGFSLAASVCLRYLPSRVHYSVYISTCGHFMFTEEQGYNRFCKSSCGVLTAHTEWLPGVRLRHSVPPVQ